MISSGAVAQERALVLDQQQVIELVRGRSPTLLASRSREQETRAAKTGASAPSGNPELAASVGPRIIAGVPTVDVAVLLSVPFDVSGAPGSRSALADERTRVAESQTLREEWTALADALGLWVQVAIAADRATLEAQRAVLDAERLRIAQVRRAAGAVGDGDVALALVLEAEGKARQQVAVAEHEALSTELRHVLGLSSDQPLAQVAVTPAQSIAQLDALLANLQRHPALTLAKANVKAAGRETSLQRGLAFPLPRATLTGERSPEYVARLGFDVLLPFFQRNQTQTAVAQAREQTGVLEFELVQKRLESEIRAAYARLLGARNAYASLRDALPAVDDAEHLSTRAYELGQVTLAAVVAVHREVAAARSALLDAKAAALRAQIVTQLASGSIL